MEVREARSVPYRQVWEQQDQPRCPAMTDPFSVASGAIGIVALGLTVTKSLVDFYIIARDQKSNTANTARNFNCLLDSLKIIDSQIADRTFRPDERDLLNSIERSIQTCDTLIRSLEAENEKFRDRSADSISAAVRTAVRGLAYPFS